MVDLFGNITLGILLLKTKKITRKRNNIKNK